MKLLMAAAALGALFSAMPASAAHMMLTFSGTADTAYGTTPFGPVGPATPFTASFLITTDAPALTHSEGSSFSRIDSGTGYGAPADNLAVVGSLKINGISFNDLGFWTSSIQYADKVNDPAVGEQHSVYATAARDNYQINLFLGDGTDFLPSAYLTTEFSHDPLATALSNQSSFTTPFGGYLRLTVMHVSSQAASVPEPASWSMMIAGFGAVGMTARRRRQATSARA